MALLLALNILLAPEAAFQASLTGLEVWWNFVFPILLPYFILIELMLGSGMIQRLAGKLNPISQRLLGIPGLGGAAVISGWFAGYPAGAKFTALAVSSRSLSVADGEKTLILSHLCHPVLVVNLAAVIFLKDPLAGPFILCIQWLTVWIIAICLNWKRPGQRINAAGLPSSDMNLLFPPMGKLLTQAVKISVQQLFIIGGVMIFFSVILHTASSFTSLHALLSGLLEVHLGIYYLSQLEVPYIMKLVLIVAAVIFGGFSLQVQVKSLISGTKMRYRVFLFWKVVQTAVAVILTLILWLPYQRLITPIQPTFKNLTQQNSVWQGIPSFWEMPFIGLTIWSSLFIFLLILWPRILKKG